MKVNITVEIPVRGQFELDHEPTPEDYKEIYKALQDNLKRGAWYTAGKEKIISVTVDMLGPAQNLSVEEFKKRWTNNG